MVTLIQQVGQVRAQAVPGISGPLVRPGDEHQQGYLRQLQADGNSNALWLFGACRAWVVKSDNPDKPWHGQEWLDRETELFTPMRKGGLNLLNQWMAPWEFLLIHSDRAEYWRQPDDSWKRIPLPTQREWSSYQCFDQGRAQAFDRLLKQAEGNGEKKTIYLLLSPLPHQCLQVKEHPWGSQESGWSPENDAGKQTLERLNGFSGFQKDMNIWDFFKANPRQGVGDWRSQLFDHQANFFRYVMARWGYSRALGVWVLVDELDAVGDEVGVMATKDGWWKHPQCRRWLADIVKLFRNELTRSDGLTYQGDPFQHPLHAATTSFGGQSGKGGNLEWDGGPIGCRPDLFGWHWYPYWERDASWPEIWLYTIDGLGRYSKAPTVKRPRLVSEFGAPDRYDPDDAPSVLYPSLFHFAAWAAIFSGQAGTPMDWDDGKEFGELTWRNRDGIFKKDRYPINHIEQIQALRTFLDGVSPDDLAVSDTTVQSVQGLRAYVLPVEKDSLKALGWIYSASGKGVIHITELAPGDYTVTWYDPWTGKKLMDQSPQALSADKSGRLTIDPHPVLEKIRLSATPFPQESRLDRGRDLAFKLHSRRP